MAISLATPGLLVKTIRWRDKTVGEILLLSTYTVEAKMGERVKEAHAQ